MDGEREGERERDIYMSGRKKRGMGEREREKR